MVTWVLPSRRQVAVFSVIFLLLLVLNLPLFAAGPAPAQNGPGLASGPRIWLQQNQPLPVQHVAVTLGNGQGMQLADSSALAGMGQAQPVSMASGDLDADGFEDLVVGYSTAGGGFISIHRGNIDAFAPQSDASFQAIGRGEFASPFHLEAKTFSVPVSPDFIAVGDFAGGGNKDLAVAAKGGNTLLIFANDGKGNFSQPQTVNLLDTSSSLATGEFGSSHMPVLIVGGSRSLTVYVPTSQGLTALASYPLAAPASNILFGDFGDPGPDAAFLADGHIQILRSSNMQLASVSLPVSVRAFALGSFLPDRNPGPQLAVVLPDGSIQIAVHNEFDPRIPTIDEVNLIRQAAPRGRPNPLIPAKSFPEHGWKIAEAFPGVANLNAGQTPVFFRTRVSSHGADDVMLVNAFSGQLVVISHPDPKPGDTTFASGEVSLRPYSGSVIAALPVRINVDGRPGVMAIHQGEIAPSMLMPIPDPTFFVNRFDDPVPGAVASTCNNVSNADTSTSCSLREAVRKANATAGTDTIQLVSGTYTLTQARVSGDFTAAHGTLDITDSVNIVGATDGSGNPASIIQACDPTPNPTCNTGVDKVFSFNQDISSFTNATVSISNLVIRFGHNRGAFGGLQDGFGGAFDYDTGGTVAGTGNANLTVTNCNITNNTTTDGDGGGAAIFNTNSGTGFAHFVSSTIQNNSPTRATSGAAGGGIFVGSPARIVLDSTNVINNTATQTSPATGNGGGIFTFGQPDPSLASAIHSSTISGNQAAGDGGGLNLDATITIDTGTVIANNQAGTAGGGATNGGNGGGILFSSQTGDSLTISKVTIAGNSAAGGAGATPGGGGIWLGANKQTLSMQFSRLAGNTAPNGKNLDIPVVGAGSTLTATDNWWGINTPASTITQGTANSVTFDPFIVLTHTASPNKIRINQSTTLTADMSKDNHGNGAALSGNLNEIIGIPIIFNNAVDGSISGAQTSIQSNGTATATFNAGSVAGGGKADAVVDQATVTANIIVLQPPSITKSFSPKTIQTTAGTGTTVSTITFSISNPNVVTIEADFTDNLPTVGGAHPGSLVVASTPSVVNGCGGSVTAVAGSGTISFSNPALAVSGSPCTITVNVSSAVDDVYNNSVTINSTDAGNGNTSSDTLTVINPPSIAKSFNPTSIPLNGTSSLTFTITNSNVNTTLNGVAFTDTLPTGLTVVTNTSTVCGGTLNTTNPTGISLTGAAIAPGAQCQFSVTVTGATAGQYTNTTGNVSSTNGGTGNTATANLTVVGPPTISKSFSPKSVPLNSSSTLSFTVTNPNTFSALSGVAFTDTLPGGLKLASTTVTGSCGSGTITATINNPPGSPSTVSLSGGTLTASPAAGSSCTFSVSVTGISAGAQVNTTSTVSSTEGGTGGTATDTLTVVAPPTISKSFSPKTVALNSNSTLSFTVTNPNTASALSGVAFTDSLPGGVKLASTTVTGSCGSGTITATINNPPGSPSTVSLSGGTLTASPAAGSSCTFSVSVTGISAGAQVNTTSTVSSTEGGTGGTASDTLTVIAPATISKSFSPKTIPLNGGSTLSFTLTNPNTVSALSGVAFTDTLPGGVKLASTTVTGSCGSGTITATINNPPGTPSTVSLSGGTLTASPDPASSCTFSVSVTGISPGAQVNTTSTVSSTEGGTGGTATDTLVVVAPPTISKHFGHTTVPLNQSDTLSFTLTNPNTTSALSGIAFTDSLPGGLKLASTTVTGSCGSGTITATINNPPGTPSTVSLSGGTLTASPAAGSSCTFSVSITGISAGAQVNTTSTVSSTEGGTGGTATDTITVVAPPTTTKIFNPTTISVGGTSTMTITITNPSATVGLTGVGFTDTFPANLVVATPNGLSNTCNGTPTATAGSGTVSLTGGTIAANSSCAVTVNVTSSVSGSYLNSTGPISSTEGGNGAAASATLTVASPPTISKSFSPKTVPLNGSSTLSFTITNPNNNVSLSGISVTDSLPGGVKLASTTVTGSCGSGTITATINNPPGSPSTVSLSGGTLATSGSCTFSVSVTGISAGAQVNTTSTVSSTEGGTGGTATDTLVVVAPPTISKHFGHTTVPLNQSDTLSFTLTNPNTTSALSGIAFTDSLPGGLKLASTTVTGSCGSGTITATINNPPGTPSTVSLSGGTLTASPAAGSSCTFSVSITGISAGAQVNTTSTVSSTEGGTGGTATDTITVVAPPTTTKVFNPTTISVGGTSTMTITITNPSATVGLTGVGFTDTFPTNLVVANPNGFSNTCNGTTSATAGSGTVSLTGGTIAANSSCAFTVNVTSSVSGVYLNSTGPISSTEGGNGAAASATLTVASPPSITKSFNPTSIALNATSTLSFSITNPNTGLALSGVAFTDSLPAGVVVAATPNITGSCGSGTITATAGSGTISLSGGTLTVSPTAGSTCNFSVDVTGTTAGVKNNSVQVTSTEGGTGNTSNASLTVTAASTATAVTSSSNPSVFGQSVTFTATVTNTSAGSTGAPTGSVQFVVDGVNFGSPVALTGASSTSSTATSAAIATLSVAGSPHTVSANYINADGNFTNSSGSLAGGQTITLAITNTAVVSSSNPSVFGQSVTFTATVVDVSAGSTAQPTGSVQFVVDGAPFGSPVTLTGASSNSSTATSGATATLSIAGSPHSVSANYVNADGNFSNSTGSLSGGQVVNQANTTTTVISSQGTITLGDTVTFTATVTANPPGSGTPTGRVTFFDGATPLASGTLNGSAQATFSTSLLAVGSNSITAIYSGDADFTASPLSSPTTETVNLRTSTTSVALNPTTVGAGQASTITVTVTDAGASNPPGTPDVFASTGAPATGRTGFTSTLFADGLVLVAGGTGADGTTVLNSAEIYSVSGAAFTATGNLNTARTGAVAVLLPNGKVLVAGGSSNGAANGALNSAELFDPGSGTFTATSHNMTAARFGTTATLLNTGKVLIAGGANSGVLNSAELYDPSTDTFTATGNLNAARTGASATLLGTGKVLVAGGSSNGAAGGARNSAELFDPAGNSGAGTFTSVAGANPTLATGRWQPEAALLLSGKVLVAGGQDSGGALTTADVYDPVADSFTASSHQMNEARANGSAVALPNGMVLLPGGTTSQAVDLYDADSDRFDTTGSLLHHLSGSATLLNNGRVLVVGINTDNAPTLVSDAELYSPSFNPLGTVGFSSSEPTDVFGPACVLMPSSSTASTCTSTVTPIQVATSPHTITGTYPADAVHSGSSNSASLTVIPTAPPTIAKAFSADKVAQNSKVNVSFTIVNPNAAATLTGISFTDALPAGLVVATPNNLNSNCGGTVTAVAGSSSISLTGGTVAPAGPPPQISRGKATRRLIAGPNTAASGQCVISLDLLVTGTGTISNTTGPVSANESGPGNPSNTASIQVVLAPTVNKAFGAASIPLNGTTSLTFNIANPNTATTLVGIALTDTLPSGLVVATPNGATGSCLTVGGSVTIAGTLTAAAGGGSVSLSGLSLNSSGSCSFSVNVTGTSGGTKNNTTAPITGTFDDGTGTFRVINGGTASASIVVVAPPVISKAFVPPAIAPGGVSALTFTITNPAVNSVAETGVAFTDTLPANVVIATPNGLSGSCGGTVTATAGTGVISLAGGSVAAASSCVFSVNVTSSVVGSYTNTTGAVSSTNGGTGNTASANLSVAHANLSITKTHTGNFPRGSTNNNYTITVSNNATAGPTVGTVTVTDTLPNVNNTLVPTAMTGTGWSCTLATLTCTRSDSLAPGASYPAITLTVTVPQNIQANVTNSATVSGGGDPNSHTANDPTHIGPPIIVKIAISNVTVNVGGTQFVDFTVDSSPGEGTVNFACSGLAFGMTCSFNPPSTNQLSTSVTMGITASAGSGSVLPPGTGRTPPLYAALLPLLGLIGLWGMVALSRGRKIVRLRLGLALAGLTLVLALVGCGGTAHGAPPTPQGTFQVTVTATSATTGDSGSAVIAVTVPQ